MEQDDALAVKLARNRLWPEREDRSMVVGAVSVLLGDGSVSDSVLMNSMRDTAEEQFRHGADGFCLDLTGVPAQFGGPDAGLAGVFRSELAKVDESRIPPAGPSPAGPSPAGPSPAGPPPAPDELSGEHTAARALLIEVIGDLVSRYSLPIAVLGAPSSWQVFCWEAGASLLLTESRNPADLATGPTMGAPQLGVFDLRARAQDRHGRTSGSGTENPTGGREVGHGPGGVRDWECAAASVALNSVALNSVALNSGVRNSETRSSGTLESVERDTGAPHTTPIHSGMSILICTEVSAVRRVVDMFAAIQAHREAPRGTEAQQ